MYIQKRNRFTDIETNLWIPKGRVKLRWTNYGYAINRYKELYIKYKLQGYIQQHRNYTYCLVITIMEFNL